MVPTDISLGCYGVAMLVDIGPDILRGYTSV
jgi:hypothetical protein